MDYQLAKDLMDRFVDSTGLTGQIAPRRYLWTDAFAVCNFLSLYRAIGDERYLQLAVDLVDQTHYVLGRHRPDDSRCGWISGLSEEEGARHPTRGGLRIGKKLKERSADQTPNSRLEWDQDGQYFHYLTKWMHALCRLGHEIGEDRYVQWAAELAVVAYRSFTYEVFPGGPKRMVWKMCIDLTRPLVSSMGHHDPLDGLITCLELHNRQGLTAADKSGLDSAISNFSQMCRQGQWSSEDPLGIGGLLDDAVRLAEMIVRSGVQRRDLLVRLLHDARSSLQVFASALLLEQPADHRLAFRELGLSIGLHGLPRIAEFLSQDRELANLLHCLLPYETLSNRIESFWIQPAHQKSRTWLDYYDINTVMLATSLLPDGHLTL